MSYRILDVKVAKINLNAGKLVIKKKKSAGGSVNCPGDIFFLDTTTLITSNNNQTIPFSEIKVGKRVTIDFIKVKDSKLLVKGISVLN